MAPLNAIHKGEILLLSDSSIFPLADKINFLVTLHEHDS